MTAKNGAGARPRDAKSHRRSAMTAVADCQPGVAPSEPNSPDLRPVEGVDAEEELAALTRAVGHPARVRILRILVRKNACIVGAIVDELPLSQSTVSQHLKVLKDAGLIRGSV